MTKLLHLPTNTEIELRHQYEVRDIITIFNHGNISLQSYTGLLCHIYKLYEKTHPNPYEIDDFEVIEEYFKSKLFEWELVET